jgi:hypothetical protein
MREERVTGPTKYAESFGMIVLGEAGEPIEAQGFAIGMSSWSSGIGPWAWRRHRFRVFSR